MSQNHTAANHENRLAQARSPYLVQHAHNPVDWYEWGEEAFEKAQKEDKPIFLSIGYSACHWCHVMAHESFEDEEVAQLMNRAFISIKVDREERPDIDGIYMTVCQMMTGRGGWPLTVLLTPDKKPFFAATYIPKETRHGRMGMMELVPRVEELWTGKRDEVNRSADRLCEALADAAKKVPGESLDAQALDSAYSRLSRTFDPHHGGFGQAPKFPTPHNLVFLLRQWKRTGDEKALNMVETTLEAMSRGGVYDQLGYGFHRYSTDGEWLVPHFEKMLYDQALMATAYIEAYQATGKTLYRDKVREIFTYVLRDMTAPEGGFYSAEDADSEGVEGKFYVWSREELKALLGEEEADLVARVFGVTGEGNFLEESTGEKTGHNILHLPQPLEAAAESMKIPLATLQERLERSREKLFQAREKRIHPGKDDKILTDWNGLMIAALARGALVFQEPAWAEAAERAGDFILRELRTPEGRLLHRYREGLAGIDAMVDDYAFLTHGFLNLYEATFSLRFLEAALDLNKDLTARFWDESVGGFYFTPHDGEALIVRTKEIYDGACPSGNSVAMLNLLRLGRMTGEPAYEKQAGKLSAAFSNEVLSQPSAFTQLLMGVDFSISPSLELVIAGKKEGSDTCAMVKALSGAYLPHLVLLLRPEDETASRIGEIAAFTQAQTALNGQATAYVCSRFNCEEPTTDPEAMLRLLQR